MNYSKLIRSNIDVTPLLKEIRGREEAWLIDTGRQNKIRVTYVNELFAFTRAGIR